MDAGDAAQGNEMGITFVRTELQPDGWLIIHRCSKGRNYKEFKDPTAGTLHRSLASATKAGHS